MLKLSSAVVGVMTICFALPACSRGVADSAFATCSSADHDRFTVVGPDGKRYPTWHPAIDPVKGCSYGHDHGQDPHGSALYAEVGDIPFGVAAQAMRTWDAGAERPEKHEGQQVIWKNGVRLQQVVDGERIDIGVRCDFLVKTYVDREATAADSMHELAYHVRCDDGTAIHATMLAATNHPVSIRTTEGAELAFFDPRFQARSAEPRGPVNPANPAELLLDLCYMGDSSGDEAHSPKCQGFPNFNERLLVEFNQTGIYNGGGPSVWYTDPFGAHASEAPFPGSVRQLIAPVTNDRGFELASQTFRAEAAHTSQYLK